jgi:hypothetical protein
VRLLFQRIDLDPSRQGRQCRIERSDLDRQARYVVGHGISFDPDVVTSVLAATAAASSASRSESSELQSVAAGI